MKVMHQWTAPVEVKVVMGLLIGIALAYLALGLVMVGGAGAGYGTLLLPVTSLLFGAAVAGGIAGRQPFFRVAGFAVVVIFGILHAFFLMAAALLWVKVFAALAAAGYIYTGVLLNSLPLRRYVLGDAA